MAGTDRDWMNQAACLGRTDLDWFDLDCGNQEASRVCYSCPVIEPCLDYAIRIEAHDGIWGGLSGGTLTAMQQRKGGGRGYQG